MAIEIERKFLVRPGPWRDAPAVAIRQGYLCLHPERTVRVRTHDQSGYLTVKGLTRGATRLEFEYAIDKQDAERMLDELCEKPLIEKRRYRLKLGKHVWEVDEFFGDNAGLLLAEVELADPREPLELPPWVVREVTDDPRFYNANLVKAPFRDWEDARPIAEDSSAEDSSAENSSAGDVGGRAQDASEASEET